MLGGRGERTLDIDAVGLHGHLRLRGLRYRAATALSRNRGCRGLYSRPTTVAKAVKSTAWTAVLSAASEADCFRLFDD